jgi:hypothetical protein
MVGMDEVQKKQETEAQVVETVFLSNKRHPITFTKPTGPSADFFERLLRLGAFNRFFMALSINIYEKLQ